MASTPSARQRKLVEEGAKGVAGRWLGDSERAAQDGIRMRSAVKRFSGKNADQPPPEANPQTRARKRSTRAEQAAAGMMGPPPTTFDEKAITDWLDKMSAETLAKLAKLTAIAKAGKEQGRAAWNKVDHGIAQRGAAMHIEVHGGTVNITNGQSSQGYNRSGAGNPSGQGYNRSGAGQKNQANWGRHLARIKDFING
jgi:hypothetical protein